MLTSLGCGGKIVPTADYYAIPAPFPSCVVQFTCTCGAKVLEYDLTREAPAGWTTAEDGSPRCPACSAEPSKPGAAES